MRDAGIYDNDILIVDRSLNAESGNIVIAVIEGEMTVKRLRLARGKGWLIPENREYPAIELSEENECRIWGVVTYVIHSV